ncbi:Integral membrane protein [uncultured Rubrobacteraceae bacterium]|uniref:Integral membrane protein n=1 Tax=uncultured Rubrobacteraceae bacterium TaxID=349277 RepID=A0A6J4PUQ5_9ACTN|nr:Integral membrane protein [uncultured Rubrobacteraceae bacterium]
MCVGLLSLSAGLPYDLREGSNDLAIYREAGEPVLRGELPYRDFFIEYPPGSLPAFEVHGTGGGLATSLSPLLTLGLLLITGLAMYGEYRRSGGLRAASFPQYGAALILAFMLGSKVLSPQYMIWLLPLVPLGAGGAAGAAVCAVFLTACLLTTQVFPTHYDDLLAFRYPGPELLLVRNLLLVALWVAMLALPAAAREKEAS